MGAMTVDIAGRENLIVINRTAGNGAVKKVARTDDFVVAVVLGEFRTCLTNAVPVFRWLEEYLIRPLVEPSA